MIIGVAKGLTYYLAIKDVPGMLTGWVTVNIHSKYVFLLLLNVVLLIKGLLHGRVLGHHRDGPVDPPDCH